MYLVSTFVQKKLGVLSKLILKIPAISSMKTIKKLTLGSVALGASLSANALSAEPSHAVFLFQAIEIGNDVVLTGNGSINTFGLTFNGVGGIGSGTSAAFVGSLQVGSGSISHEYTSGDYVPFGSFGSGGPLGGEEPNSTSGNNVIFSPFAIYVPIGYSSGNPLSGTATFNNATFDALGWTPGTYTASWGSGANADSATLQIGSATAVPLETDALPILGSLAFMGAGLWMKKRRKGSIVIR